MERAIDYWFKIEPYVHVTITNDRALLYNTLDGTFLESVSAEVINLLEEILHEENYGVVLLTSERYKKRCIVEFVKELRKKYMGDLIEIDLSKDKPIQLLPFLYSSDVQALIKKHNFFVGKRILEYLTEINIYIDSNINEYRLISFLRLVPSDVVIRIIGNLDEIILYKRFVSFMNQISNRKIIKTTYDNFVPFSQNLDGVFLYSILVCFPIKVQQLDHSIMLLTNHKLPFEYVFEVSSDEDFQQVERFINQYEIEKYQIKPVYTGRNIDFFFKNVFLSKEDILSTHMSIHDFFVNKSINIFDFGKINIMASGDIYANKKFSPLGNICTHNIYDIISKELEEGKSWLRIRNQKPCNTCIYQWHCPSPSDYELEIGCPNLCHVVRTV